ncbi:ABC transporter ATP-binding protein [Frankia sp. QA3]|uniref:ABC transporter ATP-binding protein n=1 Tax=Frankia sp. QA3 TaxID=710111 RepID=UPI000269BB68|nr:ABC transporter ATP-binding protein [Frankia sp. QA3]EIV92623.1 oligopeptide/dipeptide ABC transporter, ATP-binding protein [Frankia sp. QA3]
MSDPILDVRDLRLWYLTGRGAVRAVDGVSLAVDQGQTLGIVGESGSGKTTLTRAIAGLPLATRTVRTGEVHLDGRDLVTLSAAQLRSVLGAELAMVFQDPMTSLNPVMRVGAQLTEGLRLHRSLSRRQARLAARELLAAMRLPDPDTILRRYPAELSGGMRQRVTIAIALACGPTVLLADEPTTALDVTVQAQILDLLAEMQRERSMAVVLVTHDLGVVATRTTRIAVMYGGKIVEEGPTAVVLRRPHMPYTEALLRSVPRFDAGPRRPLRTIPGQPPGLLDPPPGCRFASRCDRASSRCVVDEPPLREASTPGHRFACWHPVHEAPVHEAPAHEAPAHEAPAHEAHVHEAPIPTTTRRRD